MKFSYLWLKELLAFNQTPAEIGEILTQIGHEVISIRPIVKNLSGIVTGKINRILPHQNADKLVITDIFIGNDSVQIVTGATNINEGDIIPVSLPGAVLENGTIIKKTKLRGIESNGMLCSESELGFSENSNGIWILPNDTPIGDDFISQAKLNDSVIDVDILPNRGDCLSHIGLARDLSAYLKKPLNHPPVISDQLLTPFKIQIDNKIPDVATNYTARLIQNIKPIPTPLPMKTRLFCCGFRSIDIIVDITNYVLLEFGQPLHAFDSNQIGNNGLQISFALSNSKLTLIDKDSISLKNHDIVIQSNATPIALAGIMGGENTQVTANTESIILESACFQTTTIRNTAKRVGKRTEPAIRFERGIDPNGVYLGSKRASFLYQTLTGATVYASNETQLSNPCYQRTISGSLNAINDILGTKYSLITIKEILEILGFGVTENEIKIPSWRQHDIVDIPCIAEEVSRIIGINKIPTTMPDIKSIQDPHNSLYYFNEKLRTFMVSKSCNEIVTYPMISPFENSNFDTTNNPPVKIQNPISVDESIMRSSMMPSLIKRLAYNYTRQNTNIRFFEIGKVFHTIESESLFLSAIFTGNTTPKSYQNTNPFQFSMVQALIQELSQFLKIHLTLDPYVNKNFHPKMSFCVQHENNIIGMTGQIDPKIEKAYKINTSVYYLEIDIEKLYPHCFKTPTYSPFSRFPSIRRDIAFLAPKSLSYKQIQSVIYSIKPKLIASFYLFDLFESKDIGHDQKSMAFAFIYQDIYKTLSDEKVNRTHERFVKLLKEKLPITIR